MQAKLSPQKIELLRRVYQVGKDKPGEGVDWKDLYDEAPDRNFLDEAYDDFSALGFLHEERSGATFGGPFGQLSAAGRWFVEGLDDPPAEPKKAVGF